MVRMEEFHQIHSVCRGKFQFTLANEGARGVRQPSHILNAPVSEYAEDPMAFDIALKVRLKWTIHFEYKYIELHCGQCGIKTA